MSDVGNTESEVDHGMIPDDLAWTLPRQPGSDASPPFQVFHADAGADARTRAVASSEQLGMYLRTFAEGGGENGLHSHPTDAIWTVLEGAASFWAPGGVLLAELAQHDSILVPAGQSYRFRCPGPSTLARVSAAG